MIKFIYCVRRRPDLTPEAFREYWLKHHAPLVKECAEAMRAVRYIQSHTLETQLNALAQRSRGTLEPYDGITELWWNTIEDLTAAWQTPEGQKANQLLTEDEARFCNLPRCSVFFAQEYTIFDL